MEKPHMMDKAAQAKHKERIEKWSAITTEAFSTSAGFLTCRTPVLPSIELNVCRQMITLQNWKFSFSKSTRRSLHDFRSFRFFETYAWKLRRHVSLSMFKREKNFTGVRQTFKTFSRNWRIFNRVMLELQCSGQISEKCWNISVIFQNIWNFAEPVQNLADACFPFISSTSPRSWWSP